MLKETLCQIGFTNSEAKIYIALVELGPQPANTIARKAGLERTAVYPILKNLQKKSLISSFIKNGIIYFAVNDLNNLLEYVERKRRLLDHHRDFVIDILPKMEQLKSVLLIPPKVHYFEGVNGVETVMNDSLKSKGSIFCITSIPKWLNSDMLDFIKNYINVRVFEKKIPLKGLALDTGETRCFFTECYGDVGIGTALTDLRFIKGGEGLFDNIMNVYDNKVAIVSPDRGFEFGVLIESEEFAKTQRSIFELAWIGALVHNGEDNYEDTLGK
ncbi:MAG: helix-turn-helix domain-containing protein [Candidatus Gracilibacteria bacterium]